MYADNYYQEIAIAGLAAGTEREVDEDTIYELAQEVKVAVENCPAYAGMELRFEDCEFYDGAPCISLGITREHEQYVTSISKGFPDIIFVCWEVDNHSSTYTAWLDGECITIGTGFDPALPDLSEIEYMIHEAT